MRKKFFGRLLSATLSAVLALSSGGVQVYATEGYDIDALESDESENGGEGSAEDAVTDGPEVINASGSEEGKDAEGEAAEAIANEDEAKEPAEAKTSKADATDEGTENIETQGKEADTDVNEGPVEENVTGLELYGENEGLTITFYGEDGTTKIDEKTTSEGGVLPELPAVPDKVDHKGAWYLKDGDNWGAEVTTATVFTAATNVYAKYTPKRYNVEYRVAFFVDGEDVTSTITDYTAPTDEPGCLVLGQQYIMKTTEYADKDFAFSGWYQNKDCTGPTTSVVQISNVGPDVADDHVFKFYGKFVKTSKSFTVTFETNGGNEIEPQTVKEGKTAERPKDPVVRGHVFGGWYADKALTAEFDFTKPITANTTVFAKLTPITFTFRFEGNGGKGSMPDQTVTYGSGAKISKNTFTKEHYEFAFWTTKKLDFSPYQSFDGVDELDVSSDISTYCDVNGKVITVYAYWYGEQSDVTVHFGHPVDLGGKYSKQYVSGDAIKIRAAYSQPLNWGYSYFPSEKEFAWAGHYFDGWYSKEEGGTKVDFSKPYDSSFADIYAHWTEIEYKVTLHSNLNPDTKLTKTYKIGDSSETVIGIDDICGEGKVSDEQKALLAGWYSNNNGQYKADGLSARKIIETEYAILGAKAKTATVDIYANWNPAYSYTAIFVADKDNNTDFGYGKYFPTMINGYGYGHAETLAAGESLFLTGDEFVSKTRKLTGWTYSVNGGAEKTVGTRATLDDAKLGAGSGDVVVFTAKWATTETEYALNLVTNGGKIKGDGELRKKYKYTEPYTLPEMEKTGWVFKGWYTHNYISSDEEMTKARFYKVGKGANVAWDTNNGEFGDYTLYAVFTNITFSVVFDKDGGEITSIGSGHSGFGYDNSYIYKNITYRKNGYKIDHWEYVDDSGDTRTIPAKSTLTIKNLTTENGKTVTLKAVWTPINYTITYALGKGGSIDKNAPKNYKPGSDTQLKAPTRAGYEFDGWTVSMKDKKATAVTAEVVDGKLLGTSYGNVVLTAEWNEIKNYAFRFVDKDGNTVGAFGNVPAINYTGKYDFTGVANAMSTVIYNDDDLSVKGFALKATDTKPKYKLNTSYKMADIVKNAGSGIEGNVITLYVITEAKKNFYTLVNTVTGETKVVNYSPSKTATLNAPAVAGYTFEGWEVTGGTKDTDYTVSGSKITIKKNAANGMRFAAKYKTTTYKIVLMPNASNVFEKGSSVAVKTSGVDYKDGSEINYSSTSSFTAPNWSREDYKLLGFAAKKSVKNDSEFVTGEGALKANKKGVVTLYAIWQLEACTVEYRDAYEAEGGNDIHVDYGKLKLPATVSVGKTLTLPSKMSVEGYTFVGWGCEPGITEYCDVKLNKHGLITKITPKKKVAIKVFPVLVENTYTLKINPNGGTVDGRKDVITVKKFRYTDDVLAYLKTYFGDGVMEYSSSKAGRTGYVYTYLSLDANGKKYLANSSGAVWRDGKIVGISKLASKNNSVVTVYANWYKIPAPSACTVSPALNESTGNLMSGINNYYNRYQAQYSTDPNFKKNVVTVDKVRVYSSDSEENQANLQDFLTIAEGLSGKAYYVRARNVRLDSAGEPVYGPWSNIERASKAAAVPAP